MSKRLRAGDSSAAQFFEREYGTPSGTSAEVGESSLPDNDNRFSNLNVRIKGLA